MRAFARAAPSRSIASHCSTSGPRIAPVLSSSVKVASGTPSPRRATKRAPPRKTAVAAITSRAESAKQTVLTEAAAAARAVADAVEAGDSRISSLMHATVMDIATATEDLCSRIDAATRTGLASRASLVDTFLGEENAKPLPVEEIRRRLDARETGEPTPLPSEDEAKRIAEIQAPLVPQLTAAFAPAERDACSWCRAEGRERCIEGCRIEEETAPLASPTRPADMYEAGLEAARQVYGEEAVAAAEAMTPAQVEAGATPPEEKAHAKAKRRGRKSR